MEFFNTPARRLHIILACGMFVVAFAVGLMPLYSEVDQEGVVFSFVFAGFAALLGVLNLWWVSRTSPDEKVADIPHLVPKSEQPANYRCALWLSVIAFPALTFLIVHDLNRFESGAVEHVRLWFPVQMIYECFGYWPAALSAPCLGIICCAVIIYKLRKTATGHN